MAITVEIKLVSDGNEGIEVEYTSIPGENVTEDEIDVSNAIIALCDLLDDEDFNNHMGKFVETKMKAMQKAQGKYNIDLIM